VKIVSGTALEDGNRQIKLRVPVDEIIQGTVTTNDPDFGKVYPASQLAVKVLCSMPFCFKMVATMSARARAFR
jgi:hypothetical protein